MLETMDHNPLQLYALSDSAPCKDGKEYIKAVHGVNASSPPTAIPEDKEVMTLLG